MLVGAAALVSAFHSPEGQASHDAAVSALVAASAASGDEADAAAEVAPQRAGSSSCEHWTGLPSAVEPMQCGVIWYLHIAKTGGRDLVTEIKGQSQSVLDQEPGGFQSVRQLPNNWTLAELWYDKTMGKDHGLATGAFSKTTAWKTIQRHIDGDAPPRVIVHDHNNMIGLDDQNFMDATLRPMACALEKRGCKLTLATMLREPAARAKSHLFFEGNVDHDNFGERMRSISNYQSHYVLHNHNFHRITQLTADDRDRAADILQHFDVVGRTEEQGRFKEVMYGMLGWSTNDGSRSADHNITPEGQKLELTDSEEDLARSTNALDSDVYRRFCADGEAQLAQRRVVKPLCELTTSGADSAGSGK